MITLTSDPIARRDTEKRATELLNEVLRIFFTGLPHTSPFGDEVTFPVCDIFFNAATLPQPAERPQLHVVFSDLRANERPNPDEILVEIDSTLAFFARVANQGAVANASDFLCRSLADNVKEIFQSSDRYALAQKGITHPRIKRGPIALQTTGFQVRMLILHCKLRYYLPR